MGEAPAVHCGMIIDPMGKTHHVDQNISDQIQDYIEYCTSKHIFEPV